MTEDHIWQAENSFYQHCHVSRIAKFLAHAKLYEMSLGLPGEFVECGVFRGASFSRFRKLGALFHPDHARRFLGFDVFGEFPPAEYEPDKRALDVQLASDGSRGIERDVLLAALTARGLADNVELIQGDVRKTVPAYFERNQERSIAICNIDVDLYEPTAVALDVLFPRVVRGGIVILDDYEAFPGARRAVEEYFTRHKRPERIQRFAFAQTPCFVVKE